MTVRSLGLSFEFWLILILIESDIGLIEVIETPPSCYFLWLGLAGTLWAVAGDHRVAPPNWAPSFIFWQDIILIITSLVHRQDIIIIIKITRPKPANHYEGKACLTKVAFKWNLPIGVSSPLLKLEFCFPGYPCWWVDFSLFALFVLCLQVQWYRVIDFK